MTFQRATRFLDTLFAAVVLAACASKPNVASTGEYIDDAVITTKVKAALLKDPVVSGMVVNVESFKGVVQLSGFVKTSAERDRAIEITQGIGGVKQVKNDSLRR